MKVGDIVKFGDMPYGTHFQEVNGKRKFIKIQNFLPSGLRQKTIRVIEDHPLSNVSFEERCNYEYSAIDYDGVCGRCPDWLGFKVIKVSKYDKHFVNGKPSCHV